MDNGLPRHFVSIGLLEWCCSGGVLAPTVGRKHPDTKTPLFNDAFSTESEGELVRAVGEARWLYGITPVSLRSFTISPACPG